MPGPTRRWAAVLAWLLAAAWWLAVPAWVAATRLDVLRAGHPAYPVALAVCAAVGLLFAWLAVRRARRIRAGAPGRDRPRPGSAVARALRVVTVAALGVMLVSTVVALPGVLAWLRPFPADDRAFTAAATAPGVVVTQDATTLTLVPSGGVRGPGFVFQPGARVDPRAYAARLAPLVARGHPVVVVKQPFDIAFTAVGAPTAIMDAHPEVSRWVVGGHSLGGVAAARAAAAGDPRVVGLALWASYPDDATTMRDASGLRVLSVSGGADALATPAMIDASRPRLPASTTYVALPGVVHAFFGDYGEQPGDGTPGVDRDAAGRAITDATLAFLERP